MLSSQQLYLVNHFALVARRHGVPLPDLKELLRDETLLRQHVQAGLAPAAPAAVAEAAGKVAAAMSWPALTAAAAAPETPARVAPDAPTPAVRVPPAATGDALTAPQRALALAALQDAAGPIAAFIAEEVDALGPMSLSRYLDQAATLAQLSSARRRALRMACGLPAD